MYISIKQAKIGYKKKNSLPDTRRPFSVSLLKEICRVTKIVCFSGFESILFKTAFVLAFFDAMRISELLPRSKKSVSGLLTHHVLVHRAGLNIFIAHSKTDRSGKGVWITLYSCRAVEICPLRTVKEYLSIRPSGEGRFLGHLDGSPLTGYQFNMVLKKCMLKLGLQAFHFTSHSFRIGAATEAAKMGLDAAIIKRIGRWNLQRFNIYVRPDLSL